MPAPRLFTFFANQPIRIPARTPFPIEPATMPAISGATSGADISAVSPSKIPTTPPAMSRSTGWFMSRLHVSCARRTAHCLLIRRRPPAPSQPAPPENEQPNGEVSEQQYDQGAVAPVKTKRLLEQRLRVGRNGLPVQPGAHVSSQRIDAGISVVRVQGHRARRNRA